MSTQEIFAENMLNVFHESLDKEILNALFLKFDISHCPHCNKISNFNSSDNITKCSNCMKSVKINTCEHGSCEEKTMQSCCMIHSKFSLDITNVITIISNAVSDALYVLDESILDYSIQEFNKHFVAITNMASASTSASTKSSMSTKSSNLATYSGTGVCSAIVVSTGMDCNRCAKFIRLDTEELFCGFHKNANKGKSL